MSASNCRVALVTGAAKRIGAAVARALHADGLSVCLHYGTSASEALQLAEELNRIRAGSATTVQTLLDAELTSTEVTLEARCDALLSHCYDVFGRCDVLVNNASTYVPTPLIDYAEDGVTHVQATTRLLSTFGSNAIAPLFLTQAFARRHAQSTEANRTNNTCIVNLVDAMTNQPLLHFTAYTMAKHALEGLTESAALELSEIGIRVNGVGPGLSCLPVTMDAVEQDVYRRKVPLGQREASPEMIANAVSFLVSDKASYITGTLLKVDGGWSLTRA